MKKEKNSGSSRRELELLDLKRIIEMRRRKMGFREIGRVIGRHHTVVSRFHNSIPFSPYLNGLSALELAREMRRRRLECRRVSRKRIRLKSEEIQAYVESGLKAGWTPELIAGRLSKEHPELKTNYESIYMWIYEERRDLICFLDQSKPERRRKRASKRKSREKQAAAPKRSIENRKEAANKRTRLGDWEGDTMVSRQSKAALFNLVDRKSRYSILRKIDNCTASAGAAAMISSLKRLPEEKKRTITLDNGPENSSHPLVERELKVQTYFCHPYCASERGTVENRNRYYRKAFPKKTDFAKVSEQQVVYAQMKHNHRPMKCLGFKTPFEVFYQISEQKIRAKA